MNKMFRNLNKNKKEMRTKGVAFLLSGLVAMGNVLPAVSAASGVVPPERRHVVINPGEYFGKPGKRMCKKVVDASGADLSMYKAYDDGSIPESEFTRVFAKLLAEQIKACDLSISVTLLERKSAEEDLGAAGRASASTYADIAIHPHFNSSTTDYDESANGTEIWVTEKDKKFKNKSHDFGRALMDNYDIKMLGTNLHGGENGVHTGTKYSEINTATEEMVAVIAEMAFFTNPEEAKNHIANMDWMRAAALSIARTTVDELNSGKYDNDQVSEEKKDVTKEEVEKTTPAPEADKDKAPVKNEPVNEEELKESNGGDGNTDEEDLKSLEKESSKEEAEKNSRTVYLNGKTEEVEITKEVSEDEAMKALEAEIYNAQN